MGVRKEVYQCEDCSGCPYIEQCKKTDKNRTVPDRPRTYSVHQEVMKISKYPGALQG